MRGDLVADDTAFLYEPYAPALSWEDFQWAYGVRITALGFNDQVMALEITPGAKGQPATFRTFPAFLAGGLHGQVVTRPGAVLQDLISFKPFDSDEYFLGGAVSTGDPLLIKMAVTDPAEVAGRWIAEELRRRGVEPSAGPSGWSTASITCPRRRRRRSRSRPWRRSRGCPWRRSWSR